MQTTTAATNSRPAHCLYCHKPLAPAEGVGMPIPSDGGRTRYICPQCAAAANDIPEGAEFERETVGTPTSAGITWGYRIEVVDPSADLRGYLANQGWTSRRTFLGVEFISPWSRSGCGSKGWRTVDDLTERDQVIGVVIECKTHQETPADLAEWLHAVGAPVYEVEDGAEAVQVIAVSGDEKPSAVIEKRAAVQRCIEFYRKAKQRPAWAVKYAAKAAVWAASAWEIEAE